MVDTNDHVSVNVFIVLKHVVSVQNRTFFNKLSQKNLLKSRSKIIKDFYLSYKNTFHTCVQNGWLANPDGGYEYTVTLSGLWMLHVEKIFNETE